MVLSIRKTIRLKQFDYSNNGYYFVTICTYKKQCLFEQYPQLKQIVNNQWLSLPQIYQHINLDKYVIMPNHIHGIIIINNVGATLAVARNNNVVINNNPTIDDNSSRAGARPAPTLGNIIGAFKSRCLHHWLRHIYNQQLNIVGKFWQRNYYEHIIRNNNELNEIREYICNNPSTTLRTGPQNWNTDNEK